MIGHLYPTRLNHKLPSLPRFAAYSFVVICAIAFPIVNNRYGFQSDTGMFIAATRGDFVGYFFPNWLLPFFWLLSLPPWPIGHIAINLMNLAGLYYATSVLGGNRIRLALSFPLLGLLWYGNVSGIMAGGIAWLYASLPQEKWWRAGVAWTIMLTKPQLGIPLGLSILLRNKVKREAWRAFAVPAVIGLLSLLIWPLWPLDLLHRLQTTPPNTEGSITLWRYLGPFALLFWLPLLRAGKLTRSKHLLFTIATIALSSPYLQFAATLYMLMLPIGIEGWLVQVGFLTPWLAWQAIQLLVIVPLLIYIRIVIELLSAPANARTETSGDVGIES